MGNNSKFALNLKVKLVATILEIKRYSSYKKIAFYTIQVEGRPFDEYYDFGTRMKQKLKDTSELAEMLSFIGNIGDKWGYREKDFKKEVEYGRRFDFSKAQAPIAEPHRLVLPFRSQSEANSKYGLRLYCVVLDPTVIVLVNGDLKTERKVQDCKNCYPHFILANSLAHSLDLALENDRIAINDMAIEIDDDFDLEIEIPKQFII